MSKYDWGDISDTLHEWLDGSYDLLNRYDVNDLRRIVDKWADPIPVVNCWNVYDLYQSPEVRVLRNGEETFFKSIVKDMIRISSSGNAEVVEQRGRRFAQLRSENDIADLANFIHVSSDKNWRDSHTPVEVCRVYCNLKTPYPKKLKELCKTLTQRVNRPVDVIKSYKIGGPETHGDRRDNIVIWVKNKLSVNQVVAQLSAIWKDVFADAVAPSVKKKGPGLAWAAEPDRRGVSFGSLMAEIIWDSYVSSGGNQGVMKTKLKTKMQGNRIDYKKPYKMGRHKSSEIIGAI